MLERSTFFQMACRKLPGNITHVLCIAISVMLMNRHTLLLCKFGCVNCIGFHIVHSAKEKGVCCLCNVGFGGMWGRGSMGLGKGVKAYREGRDGAQGE